jgi:hypothetical protein
MKTVVVVALLATAALRPLAGQQVQTPAPVAPASSAATTTVLPGPRIEPQPRSYEPKLVTGGTTDNNASSRGDSHTIRMSTLTLILVVVILVLLIA